MPLVSGQMPGDAAEAFRMLKPLGGTICIGQPAAANGKVQSLSAAAMQQWLAEAGIDGGKISEEDGVWLDFQRGPLPGAGSWTHQYAEPGNTTCSDDQLVRCPLGVLWFGNPGPGRWPSGIAGPRRRWPSTVGCSCWARARPTGSALGENTVMAYDAYNGLKLWERKIRGALRVSVTHDAGNSAANDDSLFVAVGDECVRFDAATGRDEAHLQAAAGDRRRAAHVGLRRRGRRRAVRLAHRQRTDGRLRLCDRPDQRPAALETRSRGHRQGSIAISNGRLHFAASRVTEAAARAGALRTDQGSASAERSGTSRSA